MFFEGLGNLFDRFGWFFDLLRRLLDRFRRLMIVLSRFEGFRRLLDDSERTILCIGFSGLW